MAFFSLIDCVKKKFFFYNIPIQINIFIQLNNQPLSKNERGQGTNRFLKSLYNKNGNLDHLSQRKLIELRRNEGSTML